MFCEKQGNYFQLDEERGLLLFRFCLYADIEIINNKNFEWRLLILFRNLLFCGANKHLSTWRPLHDRVAPFLGGESDIVRDR